MSNGGGEFSGKRWNRIVDEGVDEYRETVLKLVDWQTEDGPPFGYAERDEYGQLEELRALRTANSDAYWLDPVAQRRLRVLEMRFGTT